MNNRKSYDEMKAEGVKMVVADWFQPDLTWLYEHHDASLRHFRLEDGWRSDFDIVRETAKAVLIRVKFYCALVDTDHFDNIWVPKAVMVSEEQERAEQQTAEARRQAAFDRGADEYNKLVAWAKENGVKGVRVGLRKVTILTKIRDAGLTYNA